MGRERGRETKRKRGGVKKRKREEKGEGIEEGKEKREKGR